MSDINTIKTKLDTDNQKGVISEKEFNDNFSKLDQTDYKKISEGLEAKDQQFLNLLQKPIFENIQKKDLLNKQSLSVNEIKTVKLFFMSYGMNANRSREREKSDDQKMAEMYINQKGIWYGLGQDGWNKFKKGFKGNISNLNKGEGKDINYPAGPININHPDIKRLNGEQLQINQQIEKVQKDNYYKIQRSMKDLENKEIPTRPLSKKLEELKGKNTLDALDELTSAPNGILYNDNIKKMTYNEKEKIQKIIENVFSNPSVNSTQVMDYVWKFHCSLGDEKRSNKTGEKVEGLTIRTNNQVGMRIEIINTCYQLAQAKGFGELQLKPETAKRSLVKLCNILTGRFNSTGKGRMMQEDNDKKFNNPELARGILESLMQINGTIDKISPVDVLKDEPSLKNKECGDFVAEISQNIPRPLSGEFGILDLVSVDEKTKISQLSATLQARVIVLKKISEKIKSDKKQIPFDDKYIQKLKNLGTNEAKAQQAKFETQKDNFKKEISKSDFWTSGFEKSAQEYGLQGADTDIFNLYRDFAVNSFWAGQLSDEVDDQIMGYAKMGAMIGGTIVTMMIFPPAGVGYLGSAIAVGVTSTVLTQMLYKKMDYNSFSEGVVDIGSQFVFDTATAFLGMKVFGPIIQKAPGFFNNVKNITSNVGITLFDVTVGATAEGVRQMGFNELFDKQEKVDILQMIRAGGVMATVFLMVSGGFHVKLPVDDMLRHLKANDPKLNPSGFKNLKISEIDYQNSIKLLELKSNALKNVDIPNQKIKNNTQPETKQKYSQNEIETNARLNDADRLVKAQELVGPLNETQKKGVIDMHNSTVHDTPNFASKEDIGANVREIWIDFADGRGKYSVQAELINGKRYELGPNGEIAGVNNLTKEQKINKQLIGEKAGLDKDKHIVPLMDSGICGNLDINENIVFNSKNIKVGDVKNKLNENGVALDESLFSEFSRETFFRQKMKNENMSKSETYIAYFEGIADVATKLENYFYNFTEVGKNPSVKEVINLVKEDILKLPTQERMLFIDGIFEYVKTMNKIDDLIIKYNGDSKKLIAKLFWDSDPNLIEGDIKISKEGGTLVCKVSNPKDYSYLSYGDNKIESGSQGSAYAFLDVPINLMNGNVNITKIHERRHLGNSLIFSEYLGGNYVRKLMERHQMNNSLSFMKDEILAFYDDAHRGFDTIYGELSLSHLNGGLYDYQYEGFNQGLFSEKEYGTERNIALNNLNKIMDYFICFDYLTKLDSSNFTKEKVIHLLSVTPFENRGMLFENYKNIFGITNSKEEIILLNLGTQEKDINKIITLQKLGIHHKYSQYKIEKMVEIDESSINKIKNNKPKLDGLGIDIDVFNLDYIANLSEGDITKCIALQELGLKGNDIVYSYNESLNFYEKSELFPKITMEMIEYASKMKKEKGVEIKSLEDVMKLYEKRI